MSKVSIAVSGLALAGSFMLGMSDARPVHAAEPAAASDGILGEWWTEGKEGRIKFVRATDGTYSGILVGGSNGAKDVNNKDPKLRSRPLAGITLMWHLRPEKNEYVDGYVYNPRDGGTYRVKAELVNAKTLDVRGYLGISLFGQTQTWTRAD